MLGITSFFLLATEVLRWDLTITTGLSAKNLVIYLVATVLVLRLVMSRTSIMAVGRMQGAFIVLIGYSIFTWLLGVLIIKYDNYELVASGIRLKAEMLDPYVFFAVFLFGISTVEDGIKVIKWILVGAVFANLATIVDVSGLINLGYQERMDGRTQGSIGESNQYAAYILLFIPGLIAAAVASRGVKRLAWLAGALVSCASLVMTASRGGFVGAAIALAVGAYLYRHLISYSRISGWVLGSLAVFVIFISLTNYGGLLTERVFGQTASIDAFEASSGRTEIWANLFYTMFQHPITFVTGFGWDVYWSFPFHFSPHNHYFSLWFNLGLIGLFFGVYLLFAAIARARRASLVAQPPLRGQLIAYVLGATGVCGAIMFVDLHTPWNFFWMYTGVLMRLTLCVEEMPAPAAVPVSRERLRPRLPRPKRDPYGWSGAPGRKGA